MRFKNIMMNIKKVIKLLDKIKGQAEKFWHTLDKVFVTKLIITVFFSTTIGIFLGLFMLQVTGEEQVETMTEDNIVKKPTALENISFYIVQAGLFEEKSNAEATRDKHEGAYIWEEDGKYYLFIDVSFKKETLEKKYQNNDTVFLKEWTIDMGEINFSEEEIIYLESLVVWLESQLLGTDDAHALDRLQALTVSKDSMLYDIYKMIQDTDKKAWAKGKILQLLFAIEKNLQNG